MVLPKNNRPHTNSSCGLAVSTRNRESKYTGEAYYQVGGLSRFRKDYRCPRDLRDALLFFCFRGDGTIRLRPDGDNAGYSGSCGGNRRVCPELRNENLPDGHEQHGERGACDEAVHAEKDESPSVDSSTRKSGSLVSRPTSSGRRMLSARPITVEPYASRMPPSQ